MAPSPNEVTHTSPSPAIFMAMPAPTAGAMWAAMGLTAVNTLRAALPGWEGIWRAFAGSARVPSICPKISTSGTPRVEATPVSR